MNAKGPAAAAMAIIAKYHERKAWKRLLTSKRDQISRFRAVAGRFKDIYQSVHDEIPGDFLVADWSIWNKSLEEELLPAPPVCFLTNKRICGTMFVQSGGEMMRRQLCALRQSWSEEQLRRLLEEDTPGHPRLKCPELATSHNSIHHLYHVNHFFRTTATSVDEIDRVVEWGGGYGNLAKLLIRLAARDLTYTIIDTPLFSCLQYVYLRSVLPEPDRVSLHTKPSPREAQEGLVNIMPLGVAIRSRLSCDLFISTWALSESSGIAQDYVAEQDWFGARHLLLAFQKRSARFPAADRLRSLAKDRRLRIEEIEFLKGNFYGFA